MPLVLPAVIIVYIFHYDLLLRPAAALPASFEALVLETMESICRYTEVVLLCSSCSPRNQARGPMHQRAHRGQRLLDKGHLLPASDKILLALIFLLRAGRLHVSGSFLPSC